MVVVWLYSLVVLLIHACLELIFVLVTNNLCNNKLCLGVFYRPPSSTCICPNRQSSLTDLVFMSSPDSLSLCSSMPCLGSADHQGLCIVIQRAMSTPYTQLGKRTIWRYAHADFDHACEMLNEIDFSSMCLTQIQWTIFGHAGKWHFCQ